MKRHLRFSLYSFGSVVLLLVVIQCLFIAVVIYLTKPSLLPFSSVSSRFTEDRHSKTYSHDEEYVRQPYENAFVHNVSFCHFRYGEIDKFDLNNASISSSVQLGSESPFSVIYNVVENTYQLREEEEESVTYCTHATPTYIHHVVELAKRWDGPISVALFVPGYDAALSLLIVDRLCKCFSEMEKVSFHFVYPTLHPPDLSSLSYSSNESLVNLNECSLPVSLLKGVIRTYRNDNNLTYPVNVHRNAARQAASTKFVLVSDIELIPSTDFVPSFIKMVRKYSWKEPHVYVLPVFEIEETVRSIPKNKRQLQHLYFEGKAVYFHRWVCLHCQLFYGLTRWIHEEPTVDLQPMAIVRRKFPYHRWEPIFVGTHEEPLYDELLTWEGRQEKMIQLHTMCLLDYKFIILNKAFLVHVPGIKRRGMEDMSKRRQQMLSNQQLYSIIGQKIERDLHVSKGLTRGGCRLS